MTSFELTTAYGYAARRNRGAYSGRKVHRIRVETMNGIVSYHPSCGCTSGQYAAKPVAGLTAADVTCEICKQTEQRVAERRREHCDSSITPILRPERNDDGNARN
jgi:hypothetical protein